MDWRIHGVTFAVNFVTDGDKILTDGTDCSFLASIFDASSAFFPLLNTSVWGHRVWLVQISCAWNEPSVLQSALMPRSKLHNSNKQQNMKPLKFRPGDKPTPTVVNLAKTRGQARWFGCWLNICTITNIRLSFDRVFAHDHTSVALLTFWILTQAFYSISQFYPSLLFLLWSGLCICYSSNL